MTTCAAGYDVVVRVNRGWRLLVRDLEPSVRASVRAVTLRKAWPKRACTRPT